MDALPKWMNELLPIGILLAVVALVIARLPRIELGHSDAFRRRRVANWLPLGLLYAFLYMGRYNLTVAKDAFGHLMNNADFGIVFAAGTITYGCSFIVNGPLTDRIGGKKAILIGGGGAAAANILMGLCTAGLEGALAGSIKPHFVLLFSVLYAANMYFQSFGAVAIVKVNAPWFHVRERGVFGAIFGILISLGIYFAFDWGRMIRNAFGTRWVFFAPAVLLIVFWVIVSLVVRDTPGQAGHRDFDTADASSGDDSPPLRSAGVFKLMLSSPIIMTIACVEFCSGFLRQSVMQWFRTFSKQVGLADGFVVHNWGMLLCCAGILGGVIAGVISDRVFGSRRGPVAAILYGVLLSGAVIMIWAYRTPWLGPLVILMSLAVIGVHGMLSGTASMDFGGSKNVGVAVGIIDGFVYAGTGVMALTYAAILPNGEPAKQIGNWWMWPVAMVPVAIIGLLLASRLWHAKPKPKAKAQVEAA